MLESTYEQCLEYELTGHKIPFRIQVDLPVQYKAVRLECGYRIDLLVDEKMIIELKCVDQLAKIHEAQLLTYMKLAHISIGLLINFNVEVLRKGLKRFVISRPSRPSW